MIKIVSLCILMPLILIASDVDVKELAQKIEILKNEERVSQNLDYRVYDPFSQAKPILKSKNFRVPKTTKKREIVLQTILNKRALIGGKWYSVGDRVQGELIESIQRDYIVIIRNNKRVKISFKQRKDILNLNINKE